MTEAASGSTGTVAYTKTAEQRTRVGPPGPPTAAKRVATFGFFTRQGGHMNAEIWIELAIVLLRILAAGISG
jgi:hypothetical protein